MKSNLQGMTRFAYHEISKEEPLRRFMFLLAIWSIVISNLLHAIGQ